MRGAKAFSFDAVSKKFVGGSGVVVPALEDVSFEADPGKVTCLIGPTGSGKSTILRMAAGLEAPASGFVLTAGREPGELQGEIGYITQRHTLFPWMRLRGNIGLPLQIKNTAAGLIERRTVEIAGMLGLSEALDLYPHEVSGGMQQRAAIGRLLASEAGYWLMDEPFSALDEKTLHVIQKLFLRVVRENRTSALFVTHSIDEAVFTADRVVILSAGPGRVVESFDVEMDHPRDRLSPEFGGIMEKIRFRIESVLGE